MAERTEDLILHPVRLRLIVLLGTEPRLTPQQLAERLPDVPPATLYRHIKKLTAAGLLAVVEQRQVRGAQEKVYALADERFLKTGALDELTREDHMRLFVRFQAALIGSFGRYLQRDQCNLVADGVSFRQASVYLTDEEFGQLVIKLGATLREAMANGPAPDRYRRSISTIIIPESELPPASPETKQEES